MRFKDWMVWSEMGTTTGDIAGFSRIAIPLVTHLFAPPVVIDLAPDRPKRRKKPKPPKAD